MEGRDRFKEQAKLLASSEQADVWGKYKKLRNQINNRIKQEEIMSKKEKVAEC